MPNSFVLVSILGEGVIHAEFIRHGSDRGIDGVIFFKDTDDNNKPIHRKLLVQVKSGANISSKDIRDLRGTVVREKAAGGVFITLIEATSPMRKDCVEAGSYTFNFNKQKYPVMQIITIKELMEGKKPNHPPRRPLREESAEGE